MRIPFSEWPGRHERHFRRKLDPLFPRPTVEGGGQALLEVQRRDHEELLAYLQSLRTVVERAVKLQPREETQVVLDLKGALEKHYAQACCLADVQSGNKQVIRQLIEVIQKVIRANAAGDPLAEQELGAEEAARQRHFELLETPLVADLLDPQMLIETDELVPVLLADPQSQVEVALRLFDSAQLNIICADGGRLLDRSAGTKQAHRERLAWLARRVLEMAPQVG